MLALSPASPAPLPQITVARLVKDETPHVIFAGAGADRIAVQLGMPIVGQVRVSVIYSSPFIYPCLTSPLYRLRSSIVPPKDVLLTPHAREEFKDFNKYDKAVGSLFDNAGL